MAQGVLASASLPLNGASSSSNPSLTAEELREILEYDRIIQFRDAVLAGTHPRVKIPPHLVGKPVAPTLDILSSSLPSSHITTSQPAHPIPSVQNERAFGQINQKSPATPRPNTNTSKSEIDPILLEKSDDLIKAEIQLQRQRLERGLREQIEQQRIATKAALQTFESLPDFDLSEVLSKALAIVQSSATPDVSTSVGARSNASDSFDERTFYSSHHDTPESSSSQGQTELHRRQPQAANSFIRPQSGRSSVTSTRSHSGDGDVVITTTNQINKAAARSSRNSPRVPSGLKHPVISTSQDQSSSRSDSSNSRGAGTFAGMPGALIQSSANSELIPQISASDQRNIQSAVQHTTHELLNEAFADTRPSPLIRAHNLSPHAPQPARVSPLATARDAPLLRDNRQVEGAPPAQVAALRHVASGLSSTDSSPKAGKVSEKKKKKDKREKKRKAKENGPATPESPYIKPEPQSPEPFASGPLSRPNKRQRQSGQFGSQLTYEEPEVVQGPFEPRRLTRVPREYQREEEGFEPGRPRMEPVYRHDDGYRVNETYYAEGPRPVSQQYAPVEARSISTAVVERRPVDEPRYYREQPSRVGIRPDTERDRSRSPILRERQPSILMAPPRKPMRIVIDEFGNEYLEPIPMTVPRQSMAPPTRYRDSEVVYERAPVRTVSARIPAEAYEEGGAMYRRASPPLARRVVTQPEYVSGQPEYRSYRQREYSARPSAAGDEFVQIRAPEPRPVTYYEEPIREHTRAVSTRPEAIRYEASREYAGRQSVRPEGSVREYAVSANPEPRREYLPPAREYSVRPQGPPLEYAQSARPEVRREMVAQEGYREYSVRPMETIQRREYAPVQGGGGYYEERRPAAEVAFIERPRAREASVVVYADDVRREMYR